MKGEENKQVCQQQTIFSPLFGLDLFIFLREQLPFLKQIDFSNIQNLKKQFKAVILIARDFHHRLLLVILPRREILGRDVHHSLRESPLGSFLDQLIQVKVVSFALQRCCRWLAWSRWRRKLTCFYYLYSFIFLFLISVRSGMVDKCTSNTVFLPPKIQFNSIQGGYIAMHRQLAASIQLFKVPSLVL